VVHGVRSLVDRARGGRRSLLRPARGARALAPCAAFAALLALAGGAHAQADLFVGKCAEFGATKGSVFAVADPQLVDLDGDGIADIIAPTATGPVSLVANVMLGLAHGDPTLFTSPPLPPDALDVRAGDVNGDGVPDLVTITADGLETRLGNGDATFGPPMVSSLGLPDIFVVSLELADVDGDGHADALALHIDPSPALLVAKGLGNGLFAAAVDHPISGLPTGLPQRPLLGDLDGDGIADVLCAVAEFNGGGHLVMFPGLAGGSLGAGQALLTGEPVLCVAAGRFDSDAAIDLAVGTAGGVDIFHNDGSGQFTRASSVPAFPVRALQAGDLNGDGLADLAALTSGTASPASSGELLSLLGDGHAHFRPAGAPAGVADGQGSLALGDINGDGVPDAVTGLVGLNAVNVHVGVGDGTFDGPLLAPFPGKAIDIDAGDLDADGIADIVIANSVGHTVSVLKGLGAGALAASVEVPVPPDGVGSVRIGKVDGDDVPDIVVQGSGLIEVLHGVGDGTFTPAALFAQGDESLGGLTLADVVGDAQLEVLTVSSAGLLTLRVDATGNFSPPQASSLGPAFSGGSPAVADFDGDGLPDVAVSGLFLMHGHGDGTFSPPVSIAPGLNANDAVISADFNRDGHADLAAIIGGQSASQEGTLAILLGHGDGSFEKTPPIPVHVAPDKLVVADINGDGLDDIAVCGFDSGGVAALLSLGNGQFAPVQYFSQIAEIARIATADFDGNGRPDLVVAGDDGRVVTFLNRMSGQFTGLGAGSIGVHGVPRLSGSGKLQGNDLAALTLDNARATAAMVLAIGAHAVALPIAGGLLLPAPDILVGGLVTDASGALRLNGRWPLGLPAGLRLWFQTWVEDPADASGFAASNALEATTP